MAAAGPFAFRQAHESGVKAAGRARARRWPLFFSWTDKKTWGEGEQGEDPRGATWLPPSTRAPPPAGRPRLPHWSPTQWTGSRLAL